jgi:hypothetical protein
MSKEFYAQLLSVCPENELMRFMLKNGRDYTIGPDSFADPHGPDPLLGAPVRIRGDGLIARTRGAVLCAGGAVLKEVHESESEIE